MSEIRRTFAILESRKYFLSSSISHRVNAIKLKTLCLLSSSVESALIQSQVTLIDSPSNTKLSKPNWRFSSDETHLHYIKICRRNYLISHRIHKPFYCCLIGLLISNLWSSSFAHNSHQQAIISLKILDLRFNDSFRAIPSIALSTLGRTVEISLILFSSTKAFRQRVNCAIIFSHEFLLALNSQQYLTDLICFNHSVKSEYL